MVKSHPQPNTVYQEHGERVSSKILRQPVRVMPVKVVPLTAISGGSPLDAIDRLVRKAVFFFQKAKKDG